MTSRNNEADDARNGIFGPTKKKYIENQKPGIDHGPVEQKREVTMEAQIDGNHQFHHSDGKDIPQIPLAKRIDNDEEGE